MNAPAERAGGARTREADVVIYAGAHLWIGRSGTGYCVLGQSW